MRRVHRIYGEEAALVTALTLARTEGLDRSVRDDFAQAGIAHMLAISGFHVAVIAGVVLAALSWLPVGRRRKRILAAALTGLYVALIGFPISACRAALIFGLTSISASLGRVPSRWGALGASGLILLVVDPAELFRPGFQLSFAGAAGLIAWAAPLERALAVPGRAGSALPRAVRSGLASGFAATVATLPFVAWHFERVAILGIPVTILATPLVSLALPGAIASVGLEAIWAPAGDFVARGVGTVLGALAMIARAAADIPMSNVWVSRPAVVAGLAGVGIAVWIARHPGVGGRGRRQLLVAGLLTGLTIWPTLVALQGRGQLEVWMIDVGQGDAIALRTPAGTWMLVDAGPPTEGPAQAHPTVRALRGLGVSEIALFVLSHADADHIGGASAVMASFRVARIVDPALPVPKPGYAEVVADARRRRIPWQAARAGQRVTLDEVTIRVFSPSDSSIAAAGAGSLPEANRASVVLLVSWADVDILLTGDAYVDVEEHVMSEVGDIEILKVGHHGSLTSTSPAFLDATTPEHALVSAGRSNRYGHPTPTVLARLREVGARVHRTDRDGTVRMRIDPDGRIRVATERQPEP